jgi:hypothetical protein
MVQPACSHARGIKTKHKMIRFINDAGEKTQKEMTVSISKAPVLQQNPLPPFH